MVEEERPKYFYLNSRTKQYSIQVTKRKPHPVWTLIKVLNENFNILTFNTITESERDELIVFLELAKEIFGAKK